MKKIVMTLGVILAAGVAFAQGSYATFGLGYAGSSNGEMLGNKVTTVGGNVTSSNINGTFGAGIPIHLAGGYMLNEHVGVELGLTYLMGSKITIDEESLDVAPLSSNKSSITTTKGNSIRVSPMLVMSTGGEGLSLYSKVGIILPVSGKTTFEKTNIINAGSTNVTKVTSGESKGKFSMGFTGVLGVAFPIGNNLSIFGELHMINLRIKANTQTVTSITLDGEESDLSSVPKSLTHTEFVNEVLSTDNADPNQPLKSLGNSSNYNSFGINIGIKMNF